MKDVASNVRDLKEKQHVSYNISTLNKSTPALSGEASAPEGTRTPEEASAQR